MDPREMEMLVQRLVANPHDEDALTSAHRAGQQNPQVYAILLEKVGTATADPGIAAHWLGQAAAVWSMTLGDVAQAVRVLMLALDKDPTQRAPFERIVQMYREKGDIASLVAVYERQAKALAPLAYERADVRAQLSALHEEMARMFSEAPLFRPDRAVENWKRVVELSPQNAYAIYSVRELLKQHGQFAEAIPYFAREQAIVDDPQRKMALFRDEADVRRRARDLAGCSQALRGALSIANNDPSLMQEFALLIVERVSGGEPVPQHERDEAVRMFVSLAEMYDGEYGLSYARSALQIAPGHDRAMQLADHYGKQLGRTAELAPLYAAYVQANPAGFMAGEARSQSESRQTGIPGMMPAPPAMQPAVMQQAPQVAVPSAPQFGVGAAPQFGAPPQPAMPAAVSGPVGDMSAARAPSQSAMPAVVAPVAAVSQPVAAPAVAPAAAPSAPAADALPQLLEEAMAEAQKGRKPQALAKYREVLKIDPANSEALSWVEDHLRQKRMYADLRDVLLAASRVPTVSVDTRKAQLKDVAGICESQLRDIETAIQAWKQICQIDRGDDQAREQLRRLLERGARWDDLATLLEQEAMSATDVEQKIALEKKLATLHEQKRKDVVAAAEAWSRIAGLAPDDETAIPTAIKLFEKGERFDLAAQVITDNIPGVQEKDQRSSLLQKLGELRSKLNDPAAAGDAFAEAAEASGQSKLWELAEKAYLAASRFSDAANAVEQRATLTEGKMQAALYAQASDLLMKAGDVSGAIQRLEQASEIDPANDGYAQALDEHYKRENRLPDLVSYLIARAEKLSDKPKRIACRRTAAEVQRTIGDREGARESLLSLLQDGDDAEALKILIEDAVERNDYQDAVELLKRLGALASNPAEKLAIALREAKILEDNIDDTEGAIERYESILKSIDPKNREALAAIANLEEQRGNAKGTAHALEREVLLAEGEQRVEIAQRLARLYEGELADPRAAIKALDIVNQADPEDFDAIARLQGLCEQIGDWPRVATLMTSLIEVEGDEEEASRMTLRLAEILEQKLGKGDEALAALAHMADQGDAPCREAYVELGDRLGWKGIVATKLVAWNETGMGPARNEALRGAFSRFLEIGREQDALRVAMELFRSRGMERALAERVEEIAVRLKDLEALSSAHDLLVKDLSGTQKAAEYVRQAEVKVRAGVDANEAIMHGESALASVPPGEVEPLLTSLAALAKGSSQLVDIFERQVSRCRAPADRLSALARAAQVAAEQSMNDRARGFFELALSGGIQEDALAAIENVARAADQRSGSAALRTILAEALAAGGQGSRDGGRTRGSLLRRAANIAATELGDIERAFKWLGDSLIAHVDDTALGALEDLGQRTNNMARVEATYARALEEVFDGPLVRKLIGRRARLRRDVLGDRKGAAVDLKKLHDLSPSDQDIMNELSALLTELGDHRGMIQLYEDQILRGRDPAQRAELARKVARIWEEDIGDAREAADAWRRVLRMKAGDQEATAGLERAKNGKLKRPPPKPVIPVSQPTSAPGSSAPPPPIAVAVPVPVPVAVTPPSVVAAPPAAPVADDDNPTADHAPPGLSPTAGYAAAPAEVQPAVQAPPAEAPQNYAYPNAVQQTPAGYENQGYAYPAAAQDYAQPVPQAQAEQPQQQGYDVQQGYGAQPAYTAEQAAAYQQHAGYAQAAYVPPPAYVQPSAYDAQAQTPYAPPGHESYAAQNGYSYAEQQAAYAQQQAAYAQQQAAYAQHQAAYGDAAAQAYAQQQAAYAEQAYPAAYGAQDPNYGAYVQSNQYPQQPAYVAPPAPVQNPAGAPNEVSDADLEDDEAPSLRRS